MVVPPELKYSGFVPLSAQHEIETIIGTTFGTLSKTTVENMFCEYVLAIVTTLYRVAVTDTPVWSKDDFRSTVDDLIAQLIDKSYLWVHTRILMAIINPFGPAPLPVRSGGDYPPTREAFRTRLQSVLEQSSAWTHYQDLVQQLKPRRLKKAAAPKAIDRTARERIVLPILDDLDWTPTKWAIESGVDPSVTLDYLAGTSTPRVVSRERLRDTLAKELKQPKFQLPD